MVKNLYLVAAIAAALSSAGHCAPRNSGATADDRPLTRIRGVPRDVELTPHQFGHWMSTVWRGGKPTRTAASQGAAEPATMAEEFNMADADGNGRITKEELADYLARPGTR